MIYNSFNSSIIFKNHFIISQERFDLEYAHSRYFASDIFINYLFCVLFFITNEEFNNTVAHILIDLNFLFNRIYNQIRHCCFFLIVIIIPIIYVQIIILVIFFSIKNIFK